MCISDYAALGSRWCKAYLQEFLLIGLGASRFSREEECHDQATCGNVVGLCLGSSSEWASLWIRGSQQYIKTDHDRERHRTYSDIVFLLEIVIPLLFLIPNPSSCYSLPNISNSPSKLYPDYLLYSCYCDLEVKVHNTLVRVEPAVISHLR